MMLDAAGAPGNLIKGIERKFNRGSLSFFNFSITDARERLF